MRFRGIVMLLFCVLMGGAIFAGEAAAGQVAVILSSDLPPYQEALAGFREKAEVYLKVYNLQGDEKEGHKIVSQIRAERPDLVVTVGTEASNLARKQLSGLPLVFTMVLDPYLFKAPNSTGISLRIPVRKQLTTLRGVLPQAKRIGVIYNPEMSRATVDLAKEVAAELGLVIVPRPISSRREVPEALRALSANIDVLWMIPDSTLEDESSVGFLLQYTTVNKIPFMGPSEYFVEKGALLSLSCDYVEVGRQAAEMVNRILSGQRPADIVIGSSRRTVLSININTARALGLNIASEILDSANKYQ